MSHQNQPQENFKQSDQTPVNQYDAAATKAGARMRDEVYGSMSNMTPEQCAKMMGGQQAGDQAATAMNMTQAEHANMKTGHGHGHGAGSAEETTALTGATAPAGDTAAALQLAAQNPGMALQLAAQNPGLALQLAAQNPALAAQLAAQNPALAAQLAAQYPELARQNV